MNWIKTFGIKYGKELKRIHKIKTKNINCKHYSKWSKAYAFIQSFTFVNHNMNDQRTHSPVFTIEEVEFLLEEYKKLN